MSYPHTRLRKMICSAIALAAVGLVGTTGYAKDFPDFEKVSEGYRKVVSTAGGQGSLYTLYRNDKDNQLLAELPRGFDGKRIFIAVSISGGSSYTGWQWNQIYCYWTRVNDKLVLMQPELQYQARSGDQIKASVKRTYSDQMILSVPIKTMGPGGGPVIDLDALLVGQSGRFALSLNGGLTKIEKCKAFPGNIEIAFEGPGPGGRLTQIHYSISSIPKTSYSPRESDERIGYFLTVFKDFSKDSDDGKQFVRYINRWNLKKRDSSLTLSPPESPIIFYVEHTVPVRYRRYVRDGILEWNKAFREIGIDGAIEVRQQDAKTGAFMDLDPEDVRYNFFRWITSERAFAMGPSRANPETGEILDADIIFDDSMMRYYALDYKRMIADLATEEEEGDESLQRWLADYPHWDPRANMGGSQSHAAGPSGLPQGDAGVIFQSDDTNPGSMLARVVQQSRSCNLALGKAHQMNLARMAMVDIRNSATYSDEDLVDGLPEKFIAQVLKEVVCHEVGHTLGLRHNFKASTWKSLDDLNADEGEAQVGSVMDYNPINLVPDRENQGDWLTPVIGPYDYWAIQYGYTTDNEELAEIVKRVAEEGLQYATDEDTRGPDPLVRRFDLGKDPINYGERQIAQVKRLRDELLERSVKDGQPWYPARSMFRMLMYQQSSSVSMVSRFIGGTYVHRDRKGDPNARPPTVPVEAGRQRRALQFVIENSFRDESFGLSPELLQYMATDKHSHWGNHPDSPEFPVHDEVMQVQRYAMMSLLSPTRMRRIYDNEFIVPAGDDALTLPEYLGTITEAAWKEVLKNGNFNGKFTNRKPMISSLRRNLQREYLTRLVDMSQSSGSSYGPPRPVQAISYDWLEKLDVRIESILNSNNVGGVDDYTLTHLKECRRRITSALEATSTYRGN